MQEVALKLLDVNCRPNQVNIQQKSASYWIWINKMKIVGEKMMILLDKKLNNSF